LIEEGATVAFAVASARNKWDRNFDCPVEHLGALRNSDQKSAHVAVFIHRSGKPVRSSLRRHADKNLPTAKPLTGFLLKPVDVRDKRAPYATLLSGIQFALHSTREIEAQWKEARRALLRTFPVSE
jgi:hypothetical protein